MKKLLTIAAVVLVAVAISVPALAGGKTKGGGPALTSANAVAANTFALAGDVQRVFTTAGALKVHVRLGSEGVRGHIGRQLVLRVGSDTTIWFVDDGIARVILLRDVKPGQHVDIDGVVDRSVPRAPVFSAKKIVVREPTPAAKLTEFACGGPVTAVDTLAGSVTLTVRSASRALWTSLGSSLPVWVRSDTKLFKWVSGVKTPITLADVKVADIVWTRGQIDRSVPETPVYSADVLTVRASPAAQP